MRKFLFAACAALFSLSAEAITAYRFTGAPFDAVSNCIQLACSPITAGQRVDGHFLTAAPLPPDLNGADIAAQVTYYEFEVKPGSATLVSRRATTASPGNRIHHFQVWTDATGRITATDVELQQWWNGASLHAPGSDMRHTSYAIRTLPAGSSGVTTDAICSAVGVSPAGVNDTCLSFTTDGSTRVASASGGGTWARVPLVTWIGSRNKEGNAGTTNAVFSVELSEPPTVPVVLSWDTSQTGFSSVPPATPGVDFTASTGTLTWAAGDGAPKTVTVPVIGDTGAESDEVIHLTLQVESGAALYQYDDAIIIDDDGAPDLDVVVAHQSGVVAPGNTIQYGVDYSNFNGRQPARGVTLTDTVPAHSVFNAAASSPGWTCLPDGNPGSTCTFVVGDLLEGPHGAHVSFAVTLDRALPANFTEFLNTVTIHDDGSRGTDPTPANNVDSLALPVPTAIPVAAPVSVPTLSVWGLMLLGCLLLAAGADATRRMRSRDDHGV